MQGIEGRKAILLLSSGVDTFSKLTFDKTRRMVQEGGVPVYAVGLMQSIRDMAEATGALRGIAQMDFLQADNQMRTFATESGGMAFFPHFIAEFPEIFRNMSTALRSPLPVDLHTLQSSSRRQVPPHQSRSGQPRDQ